MRPIIFNGYSTSCIFLWMLIISYYSHFLRQIGKRAGITVWKSGNGTGGNDRNQKPSFRSLMQHREREIVKSVTDGDYNYSQKLLITGKFLPTPCWLHKKIKICSDLPFS